jgi:hypothetical protein
VVVKFRQLLGLPRGWNSYDAAPIEQGVVDTAIEVLLLGGQDLPTPSVAPTPTGGIQLEWGGEDDGVEIEIRHDGKVITLIDLNGAIEERALTGLDDPTLSDALRWAAKLA